MSARSLFYLLAIIGISHGFFFDSGPKCPIKKYKTSKYTIGHPLYLHENFHDRYKPLEDLAKDCHLRINIKGGYYQLIDPAESVLVIDADLAIGHAFRFELHDENNAVLCNKICLSKNPTDISEVSCFLQGVANHGLTWSRYNPDIISDGTYDANPSGYQTTKIDIQTRCVKETFKRRMYRKMNEY